MKITRTLLGALAGLTLFACSNDDFGTAGNGTNEPADVLIKLNLPNVGAGTRTVAEDFTSPDPNGTTSTTNVTISYIKVTLTADEGGGTLEGSATEVLKDGKCNFPDVVNPTKIEVEINTKTGENFTTTVSQATMNELNQIAIENTPMYGEATDFTPPTEDEPCYTITVDMQHTMARLEFGGLVRDTEDGSAFSAGTLKAVFLNTLKVEKDDQNVTTYTTTEELDAAVKEANPCSWYDEVNATTFFTGEEPTSYPTEGCFAYNIYPVTSGQLPVFTLRFSDLVAADGADIAVPDDQTLYAGVSSYRISDDITNPSIIKALCGEGAEAEDGYYEVKNFPAGYIYQVRDLEPIGDGSIKYPDPDLGGFCLVATINVIPWIIVEGSVTWK